MNLILRHAQMVQPFLRDFRTGAFAHRLFHIVARHIAEQAVNPDDQLILRLILEMRLAVQRVAHQPVGILDCDDAAGHDLAAERIALADLLDIRRNAVVQRGDRRGFPISLIGLRAEFIRMSKRRILRRDVAPQLPASAVLIVELRRVIVVAQRGIFRAAAVGHEDKIVFRQRNRSFLSFPDTDDPAGYLLLSGDFKFNIGHARIIFKLHVMLFQIFYHRQNQGFVLIVLREFQRGKIRQAADVMDEALDIQLHFQS